MNRYRNILDQQKGQRDLLTQQQQTLSKELDDVVALYDGLIEAREVVNNVMLATQITIKDFIEEVVSLGLKTVFGDDYGFVIEYEIKRNKSEAKPFVTKGGEQFDPKDECGGGVIDVAALGLRMALWALAEDKPEPVLVLDEPGRFVSKDRIDKFGAMLKEFSAMFGVQIIMVTHMDSLAQLADASFVVTQTNGISNVEMIA